MKVVRLCITVSALLAATACGSAGQSGTDGKPGAPGSAGATGTDVVRTPAINQIVPRVGLVDRAVDVELSFDGAPADLAKAKVDFGPGIEVADLKPSGNALVASILISPEAKLGAHDVTVELSGADALVAKEGFVVAVPLEAKVGAGKAEQGGLVRIDVSNHDLVQFDTENFLLLPLVDAKTPALVSLANQGFTATDGSVVMLGDPLARPGAMGFLGINDPTNAQSASFLTAPDAVSVTARPPVALEPGKVVEKTLANELETAFFSADFEPEPGEGLLVDAWAKVPEGSTMTPLLLAYPESGSASELLDEKVLDPGFPFFGIPPSDARVAYPVTTATKGYFVVLDSELGSGPTMSMAFDFSAVRAQILKEKASAHDTAQNAQNIGSLPGTTTAVPGRMVVGELTADDESDYFVTSGLSVARPTDMLVTATSDADVVVRVDTVPTFDSEALVEFTLGGRAGSAVTSGMLGKDRFIQVTANPDSSKKTGKYTIGIKRVSSPVVTPPTP